MKWFAVVVFALFAAACPPASWANLTKQDRDDWQVCVNEVSRTQCGSAIGAANSNSTAIAICIRPLMDDYGNAQDHKGWLVRHGCPKDIVNGG